MPPFLALGLMSGTSADGIDAALLKTDGVTVEDLARANNIKDPSRILLGQELIIPEQ